jgi:hypothetical protein
VSGQRAARPPAVSRQQATQLVKLLDALGGVPISDAEQASLEWLAGFEAQTVANIAAVLRRARDAQ